MSTPACGKMSTIALFAFSTRCGRLASRTAAADPQYVARYDAVMSAFDAYLADPATWFSRTYPQLLERKGQLPISASSSACTSRFPFIRAGWASWRATM